MNKLLLIALATLFGAAAHAQNPAGVSPEQGNATNSKSQVRAEARKDAREPGKVRAPAGDIANTAEGGAIGNDKAAARGEARANTRDDRRRNKDGSLKRRSTQGVTPDMPGAK